MSLYDRQSMTRILDRIEELKERDVRAIAEVSRTRPLGFETLTDEEFVAWFEDQVDSSPPVLLTDENGEQFMASPWVTALAFTENGDALLRRYERAKGAGQ